MSPSPPNHDAGDASESRSEPDGGSPRTIGEYRVSAFVRSGRYATTYHVDDDNPLQSEVMLHALHPGLLATADERERFFAHAAKLGVVQHSRLCFPFDAGYDAAGDLAYFVTPPLEGTPLTQVIQQGGALAAEEIATLLGPVVEGVITLHGHGLAHLDISPDELFFDGQGIARLGPARPDWSDPQATNRGSPAIREGAVQTPEERVGGVRDDLATDVFGLGRILYESATGRSIYDVLPALGPQASPTDVAELEAVIAEDRETPIEFPADASVDDALQEIIRHSCQLSPYRRFASASDLLDALECSKSTRSEAAISSGLSARLRRGEPAEERSDSRSGRTGAATPGASGGSRATPSRARRPGERIDPRSMRRVGPYRIERFIDAGGFAWVFEVLDPDVGVERRLALKVLMPDAAEGGEFARFERESETLIQIEHPNLVNVRKTGRDIATGCHYYSMTFVEGPTLAARFKEGALPLDEIREVFSGVLDALAEIHRHGVVHRDFKPKNIMGANDRFPKLGDLGIAHRADTTDHTSRGVALGTPQYMSPEQARAQEQITPASDVFSAGLTLYEAATGYRLWETIEGVDASNPKDIEGYLLQIARSGERIPIRYPEGSNVPKGLQRVIGKACRTRPGDRYPDGEELRKALDEALDGRRRFPAWAAWAAAAVLVAALLVPPAFRYWIGQSDSAAARRLSREVEALDEQATAIQERSLALVAEAPAFQATTGASAEETLEASRAEALTLLRDVLEQARTERTNGLRDLRNGNHATALATLSTSASQYAAYCELLTERFLVPDGAATTEQALDRIGELRRAFPEVADRLGADLTSPRIPATAGACEIASIQAEFLARAQVALAGANQEIGDRGLYEVLAGRAEGDAQEAELAATRYAFASTWTGEGRGEYFRTAYGEAMSSADLVLERAGKSLDGGQIEASIVQFREAEALLRRAAAAGQAHDLEQRLENARRSGDLSALVGEAGSTGRSPEQVLREARCDTAYYDTSDRPIRQIAAFCRRALGVGEGLD